MTPERDRSEGFGETSARPTVLIVEDYQDCLDMYAAYLGLSGFQVIKACDGAAALDVASRAVPDVILMDLSLPGMDGCEVTRRLKSNPTTEGIPVVALTAQSLPDAGRLRRIGFDGVIAKPCLPDALVARVRDIIAPGETRTAP